MQLQSKIEYLEARTSVTWNEDAKAIYFSVNGDVWIKVASTAWRDGSTAKTTLTL